MGLYADTRIGELLKELPKSSKWSNLPAGKTDTIKELGMTPKTASQLEQLAKNPEVVEAVISKAEQEGRIPSRKQVLDAIKERDEAREDIEQYQHDVETLQAEVRALEQQNDELYAQKNPEPKVVEREVVREVESEASKRRIHELEHLEHIHHEDNQKLRKHIEELRKELDRAKGILRMDKGTKDVQRDVEYLITSTNQYVRQYGGLTWTFERIADVDDATREELRKAVMNLATFSNALVASLEQMQ